mmetsp:Transcript_23686/g.74497  ORF Transcript_23686/g.74497 Transcript_23686/m.74497 type:complete len:180 (-) Transcript_23686:72-611(-)
MGIASGSCCSTSESLGCVDGPGMGKLQPMQFSSLTSLEEDRIDAWSKDVGADNTCHRFADSFACGTAKALPVDFMADTPDGTIVLTPDSDGPGYSESYSYHAAQDPCKDPWQGPWQDGGQDTGQDTGQEPEEGKLVTVAVQCSDTPRGAARDAVFAKAGEPSSKGPSGLPSALPSARRF